MPIIAIDNSHNLPEPLPTFLQPPSLPVNSLTELQQFDTDSLSGSEPMDVATSEMAPAPSPSSVSMPPVSENSCSNGLPSLEKQNSSDSLMQVESAEIIADKKSEPMPEKVIYLSEEDAYLLVDLFYMPFEHGSQGVFLLQRLHWLRSNSHCIAKINDKKNSFEVNFLMIY